MKKQLTIEHLAAYLPYGIRAKISQEGHFNLDCEYPIPYTDEIGVINSISFDLNKVYGILTMGNGWQFDFEELDEIIMCVRPLSQLTETIEHNGEMFNPYDVLENMTIKGGRHRDHLSYATAMISGNVPYEVLHIQSMPWWALRKLQEWHFDTFGLIEAGLAETIPSIPQP